MERQDIKKRSEFIPIGKGKRLIAQASRQPTSYLGVGLRNGPWLEEWIEDNSSRSLPKLLLAVSQSSILRYSGVLNTGYTFCRIILKVQGLIVRDLKDHQGPQILSDLEVGKVQDNLQFMGYI